MRLGNPTVAKPVESLTWWTPAVLFSLTALAIVLPLMMKGSSCGHDFDFHLLSWMEAAHQWQHGVLKPVWAFTPAFNAGEPRLLFYPPLSWVTGAALGMVLPWPAVPVAFTWLVLLLCGLTMHRLLRRWVSPTTAVLGGCLYLCNPYMLFVAYERTAYGELMAAAWMPLLLAALLRERVTVTRVALPVALLWLTNAPSAVVGSYSVLIVGVLRLLLTRGSWRAERLRFTATISAGFLLALLLDAFYLVPLAVERRFVSLQLAVVPIARPDHNFLFHWDKDAFHTHVLTQASWIAVALCATGVVCGLVVLLRVRGQHHRYASMHARDAHTRPFDQTQAIALLLCFLAIVFFLLTRWSAPIWHVGPELIFLQFPWRFLTVAAAATVALVMLLVQDLLPRIRPVAALPTMLLLALLVGWFAGGLYFREDCADDETVQAQRTQFVTQEGVGATDEYTPADADNDELPISAPPAWIAPRPDAAPGEHPDVPASQHPTPEEFRFVVPVEARPSTLVVRLRQFPGWQTTRDGEDVTPDVRDDGLLTVPLPAGTPHNVVVRYRTTTDQWLGMGVSGAVLLGCVGVFRRRRSGIMRPPA